MPIPANHRSRGSTHGVSLAVSVVAGLNDRRRRPDRPDAAWAPVALCPCPAWANGSSTRTGRARYARGPADL